MKSNWKSQIIRFLTAQTVSLFGSSLVQYAIIWHITLTTSSGAMMTISTACGFVPQIVISLFAGVWIDRYPRKKMIIMADAAIALSTLALAIAFFAGEGQIWMLFAALLFRSAGTGIQTPTVQSIIPQIVPKDRLMRVNGINSTITSLTMLLSPAISGAILSVTDVEIAMLVDVITAVIGIGIMLTVHVPHHEGMGKRGSSSLNDIKEGFEYLRQNNHIKKMFVYMVLVGILISPSAFLTPLLVSRSFGTEVWRLTASEMVFSVGAAMGGVLIAWWGGFKNRINTTIFAGFMYGAMMIFIGLAPTFMIYLIVNMLIGITMPCYSAPTTVFIQENVEQQMHGRVFSLMQVATSCALPFGMMIFGPLADLTRVENLLVIAGLAVAIGSAYVGFCRKLQPRQK